MGVVVVVAAGLDEVLAVFGGRAALVEGAVPEGVGGAGVGTGSEGAGVEGAVGGGGEVIGG